MTSRRAGEWIARYVSRVNPKGDNVDYLMVSHFHNDHTGDASNDVPMTSGRKQDYKLTGIMEVGEYLHFSKAFDRGYPDYSYPLPIEDEDVEHYRAFVAWKTRTDNLQSEKFEVGVLDQIKLLSGEYKYKDFHIKTGKTINMLPEARNLSRINSIDLSCAPQLVFAVVLARSYIFRASDTFYQKAEDEGVCFVVVAS